jgi:uncharacterized protein involved in outer membrane biogenesis
LLAAHVGLLIIVDEIAPSRHFYEQLLGQKVKFDFGPNVAFEGDFAIHLKPHLQALLGDVTQYPVTIDIQIKFRVESLSDLAE